MRIRTSPHAVVRRGHVRVPRVDGRALLPRVRPGGGPVSSPGPRARLGSRRRAPGRPRARPRRPLRSGGRHHPVGRRAGGPARRWPGGWWLTRRALAPLEALTSAVERTHERNLHEQLPRPGHGDELDRLTEVFNGMTARLDQSFQRIREFTLHASHELKTPLTVMQGELETACREEALTRRSARAAAQPARRGGAARQDRRRPVAAGEGRRRPGSARARARADGRPRSRGGRGRAAPRTRAQTSRSAWSPATPCACGATGIGCARCC